MALLSFEMIQEIRGVADAYERNELQRLARVSSAHAEREADRPARPRRDAPRSRD